MTQPPEPQEKTPEQLQEQFNGMFKNAMDQWVADRKKEEADEQEKAPERTTRPRGLFQELFGG